MRQYSRLNSENKNVMDEVLSRVTGIFPGAIHFLTFVGSILYLKKVGVELSEDYSDKTLAMQLSEYDKLLSKDALHDIILDVLKQASSTVHDSQLKSIMNMVGAAEFNDDEYLYWYDYMIENAVGYKSGISHMIVPNGITALAQAFVGTDINNILIPFGGIMNFATELEGFDHIDSYELNLQIWQIGMLRIAFGNISEKATYYHNSIDSWPNAKYDAIVSMPPFGIRMEMKNHPLTFNVGSREDSELIAPSRFLENSTDDGVCVAFAPASILCGESYKRRFRIWTIEQKILDTIILLPANILNGTGIQLACVILRKKPHFEDGVRMIDATGIYTEYMHRNQLEVGKVMEAYHSDIANISSTFSYEEIKRHDYSWNVKEYFLQEQEYPAGFIVSALEDIISMPRLEISTTGGNGPIVKVSDLSDDWSHPYIDIDNLAKDNIQRAYARLDRDAILLSTIRTLKPSIIKASKECPVWVNPNILVIIPSSVINAEYLCMKLAEMDMPTLGLGVPHISRSYLLRQKIAYPELPIQSSMFMEGTRNLALAKAKELGLQELVDQMKADYINEVRARKHDMKTPMAQLRNTLTLLKALANKLPEEYAGQLDKYVKRQQKAMDVLSEIVSHIADEDVFATPEVVDIEAILKGFETMTEKYVIEYHRDDVSLGEAGIEVPYLKIGKVDFVRLVQNIVSNAIKRGFVKNHSEYALHITLSVENDFFVIDFSNNGEPLPDGMDKVRYGTKGAKGANSDGSGTGGYVVKIITQHYGGDYDIFSTKFANMNFTNVIVKLPIYRKEDE